MSRSLEIQKQRKKNKYWNPLIIKLLIKKLSREKLETFTAQEVSKIIWTTMSCDKNVYDKMINDKKNDQKINLKKW